MIDHTVLITWDPLDFFISYTGVDQSWAESIAWWLEDAGYTVCIQAWDFRPGNNFVLRMHEASTAAKRTLIVLSPAYLEATFTEPEWAAAFASDPKGTNRKIIPVRVRPCKPTGLLGQIIYVDLVGVYDEEDARRILLKGIPDGRAKPDVKPRYPGA